MSPTSFTRLNKGCCLPSQPATGQPPWLRLQEQGHVQGGAHLRPQASLPGVQRAGGGSLHSSAQICGGRGAMAQALQGLNHQPRLLAPHVPSARAPCQDRHRMNRPSRANSRCSSRYLRPPAPSSPTVGGRWEGRMGAFACLSRDSFHRSAGVGKLLLPKGGCMGRHGRTCHV